MINGTITDIDLDSIILSREELERVLLENWIIEDSEDEKVK